ncbi:MAG: type II toxin-antitoxin system RelE/ParE family toxin, partial [Steroidobacteraceae bacterium]
MRSRNTRPISWIAAAKKEFEKFPSEARELIADALTLAADGGKAGIARPMKGLGSGIFEVALKYRGDAFRAVYA